MCAYVYILFRNIRAAQGGGSGVYRDIGGPPHPNPKAPIFYIFGAWGPQQGGAAAPGGGANLAKCPFLGKTSRENPKSKKWSKKEGSKTMLEMIAAKF